MEASELIKKYLTESRMMQVATLAGDQPWVCTVYYVEDGDQSLYWLSLPTRRHSQEITKNAKIAVAIPVKFDKNPIIGIQAEGSASEVTDASQVAKVMKIYVKKYNSGKDFYENFVASKNKHHLYKFAPIKYFLFDETNFSDGEKHKWTPND